MKPSNALDQGRKAFRQKSWKQAYSLLSAADQDFSLPPDDLNQFALASYLTGKIPECTEIWTRAHQKFLHQKEPEKAIRCAFWLGLILLFHGEKARGGGWIARAHRLLEELTTKCVEQGYLLLPIGLQHLAGGNAGKACKIFEQAAEIAAHFNETDLIALSRLGRGQSLIRIGKSTEGTSLLDESMVAVESGEVSSIVAGIIYCAVIETCMETYDLNRAIEWTNALRNWCDSQPDLVPFRGQCLIRRSEIMQLHGNWADALQEAKLACELLTKPTGEPAAGLAFYRIAELYRLYGEFRKAEYSYREAGKWGRNPQPGLALLRMAQRQTGNAVIMITRAKDEAKNQFSLSEILPAFIEIMIVSKNIKEARSSSAELQSIADSINAIYLTAATDYANGAVYLAEGNIKKATDKLRNALTNWELIKAPYQTARTRFLLGVTSLEFGDKDTAGFEFEAALEAFKNLGAVIEISRIESILNKTLKIKHVLTDRELQILRLIASGKTNKSIASDLFISERTVDRHVSNILLKLDLPTRTAATSYAYKNNLV